MLWVSIPFPTKSRLWKAIAVWKYPLQVLQAYSNGTQNGWKELVQKLSETVVVEQFPSSQWTQKLGLKGPKRDTHNLSEIRVVVLGKGSHRFICSFLHSDTNECLEDSEPFIARMHNIRFLLSILNTAGQEGFPALIDQYIKVGEAFLILCKTTSNPIFERLDALCGHICRTKDEQTPPVVLVGLKKDPERKQHVNYLECYTRWAKEKNVFFIGASTTTREGVSEAFTEAVRLVLKKRGLLQSNANDKKKKCICS
jgi:GTPase SAR1 family protein